MGVKRARSLWAHHVLVLGLRCCALALHGARAAFWRFSFPRALLLRATPLPQVSGSEADHHRCPEQKRELPPGQAATGLRLHGLRSGHRGQPSSGQPSSATVRTRTITQNDEKGESEIKGIVGYWRILQLPPEQRLQNFMNYNNNNNTHFVLCVCLSF